MARIFGWLCEKIHYKFADGTRAKLMLALAELYRSRDRHFGNGRAVRNLFEQAIRRMANRVADIRDLSPDELMLLEPADIEFTGLPAEFNLDAVAANQRLFRVVCPKCSHASKAPGAYLGRKVRCPKCHADFFADWGKPEPADLKPA